MNSDFKDLLSQFNAAGIRYLIIGGYAVIFHTEPRYTKDLDIWVENTTENAQAVFAALRAYSAPLSGITIADFEAPDTIYQMGRAPVRVDIFTGVEGVEFSGCWARRITTSFEEVTAFILSKDEFDRRQDSFGSPARFDRCRVTSRS